MGPLAPLLRRVARTARRLIHHSLAAIPLVDRPTNRTYGLLQYTDNTPDLLFTYPQVLDGEALHRRLDALIDEHLDANLCRSIWVVVYDANGDLYEEEIPFQLTP